ncbi:hypothetical protein F4604DRAFT_1588954, partial [Suillus subluteus]
PLFLPSQLALAFPRTRGNIVEAVEKDKILLSPGNSRSDQMQELVIKLLHANIAMKFRHSRDTLHYCHSCS